MTHDGFMQVEGGSEDTASLLGEVTRRLRHDLAEAGLPDQGIRFFDDWSDVPDFSETAEGLGSRYSGASEHTAPTGPVCVRGGHAFVVPVNEGLESAVAYVADVLASDVMDELGRPWPQALAASSGRPVVLEPGLADGSAVWRSETGEVRVRVGELSDLWEPGAAP